MAMDPLVDGHGRRIGDLRVSVTDRCNFRCQYCMPAEGLPWLERDDVLHFEEIERLVGAAGRDGRQRRAPDRRRAARAPRLPATGRDAGPARRGPEHHHQRLPARARRRGARARGRHALQRLDRLAAARPLLRDDPPRRAAAGAARPRGAGRASPRRTRSRSTPSPCAASPRTRCCRSRTSPASTPTRCASSSSCRSTPTTRGRPTASSPARRSARSSSSAGRWSPCEREPHATARVYRFADGRGSIGFINPVSEPFCGDCNRIRLTADGRLRTCLFSLNETDLRAPLRAGAERRRARADRPRRGVAQGAQAPRQRAGLRPARADDERHRRLNAGTGALSPRGR